MIGFVFILSDAVLWKREILQKNAEFVAVFCRKIQNLLLNFVNWLFIGVEEKKRVRI